ncbi:39S ribosomal protein L14, mitochondrial [Bulinus truncatus]|nr:39S ribosomal protein L14, mitochondrial [Bulinus truncatus]
MALNIQPQLCKALLSVQKIPTATCNFSTSQKLNEIRKLARMRIVDNSAIGKAAAQIGKPPRVIHVYNRRQVGYLGDKVLVTVKGEMKRAYIVGLRQKQLPNVPRMDTNNIVLVDDKGDPLGTRIMVPIPSSLRGKGGDMTKILSLATRFV